MSTSLYALDSRLGWIADGVQTVWNFSFSSGYIYQSHVKAMVVDVDGISAVELPLSSVNFIGPSTLSITPAVAAGKTLIIYRKTPKDVPLVNFQDGARISETSLDLVAKQGVFVAAEAFDALNISSETDLALAVGQATTAAALATAAAANAAADAAATTTINGYLPNGFNPLLDATSYVQAALNSGSKEVNFLGRPLKHDTVTVPAGVSALNVNSTKFTNTAGSIFLVNSGCTVTGKIAGTGLTSAVQRCIYPAADGVSDVYLLVEVSNVTYGVHAQYISSDTDANRPKRWRGYVYARDIVGTIGFSEGYGVLLSPAESCELVVRGKNVRRHTMYLSAGASYNNVDVDTDGCGNYAVQIAALHPQGACIHNNLLIRARNLTTDVAGQSGALALTGKSHYNNLVVFCTGNATTVEAVRIEGGSAGVQVDYPKSNSLVDGVITGQFTGGDVIRLLNQDGTTVARNRIAAYAVTDVIGMRRTGINNSLHGGYIYDNTIDALGQSIRVIYNEINSVPSYIGPNTMSNHGNGQRIDDDSGGFLVIGVKGTATTPGIYGAVGDGVTDDTLAVQEWSESSQPHAFDENAVYYVNGTVNLPAVIDGRGATIKCGPLGNISRVGALTALPALAVAPASGDQAFTFASAHNLAYNDVVIVYNPAASSFSAIRPEFKAGEFTRIAHGSGVTTVDLSAPLYAGYSTAAVSMFKVTSNDVVWRNFSVVGPDAVVPALKITLATSVSLTNVKVKWANYMGLYLDRCKDVTIVGGGVYVPKSGLSDCFGLFIGNTQDVTVQGGSWFALRNASDCGGDLVTCCVPNRNIKFVGASVYNKTGSTGPAFNLHGNTEGVIFSGGSIVGGASFEGRDIAYSNAHISGAALGLGFLVGGGSECLGGTYSVRGCTLVGGPAYSTALVRVSSSVNGLRDNHLICENNVVSMGACVMFARNDMASSTYKANATINGVTFVDGAPSMTTILRMIGNGAGDGDFVVVDNVNNAPPGCNMYIAASGYGAATPARLMVQTGSASVALISGQPITSVTATYPLSYGSKVPKVQGTCDTRVANAVNPLGVAHRLKNAAAVTFDIYTTNNANAGASPTVTVDYSVGLSEV